VCSFCTMAVCVVESSGDIKCTSCLSLRASMGEVDELCRDGGDAAETILIWLFRRLWLSSMCD
jgi:hypothetical protein